VKILIKNKKYLSAAAKKLLKYTGENKLFAFYGSMGAGKTTLIKAICKVLGAVDIIKSPSFTIVNEYITTKGESLYHIDFYRIKKQEEVFDLGIEEYLTGDSYCFMEWPELIREILPPGTISINITVDENEQRTLFIS
jgi:tRNA threonylcarbamoyladenosine biosynthesis protein TsaE